MAYLIVDVCVPPYGYKMTDRPNKNRTFPRDAALARFLDGEPEPEDVELIAEAIAGDPMWRKELAELLAVDELLRQHATGQDAIVDAIEICVADPEEVEFFVQTVNEKLTPNTDVMSHAGSSGRSRPTARFSRLLWVAAVLTIGAFVLWYGKGEQPQNTANSSPSRQPVPVVNLPGKLNLPGRTEEGPVWVAVVRKVIDVDWDNEQSVLSVGETMASRRIQFQRGLVELQTNKGALVRMEGPVDLTVVSGMKVLCHKGRLRVDIPESAHGFVVRSPLVNVVDRGTSFAMDVGGGSPTEVHVIDGMVELESKLTNLPKRELLEGQSISVNSRGIQDIPSRAEEFPSAGLMTSRLQTAVESEMKTWKRRRDAMITDPTCFMYFDFEETWPFDTVLTNHSPVTNGIGDGTTVGCGWAMGRWRSKRAVVFRNDFDRLLVPLSKKLTSFSCTASVRVDSLDSRAIYLLAIRDSENESLEWQLTPIIAGKTNGRLRLKRRNSTGSEDNYLSKPFFRPEQVGTWLRLAFVWDAETGVCRQYVNGKLASTHKFKAILGEQRTIHADHLEIGNGEGKARDLGFSSTHLSGCIDEFSMFDRAMTAEEIRAYHTINQIVWSSRDGNNHWEQASNWAAGIVPETHDYVTIDNAGKHHAHFSKGETPNLNAIRVGTFRGRTGLLQISGGTVTALMNSTAASRVGVAGGDGTVMQRGGRVDLNALQVGLDSGSTGIYRLFGGKLTVHRRASSVGSVNIGSKSGNGTFEISGGSLETRFGVTLGDFAGIGMFRVNGSHAKSIAIGSFLSGGGSWIQNHGSTMQFLIDAEGVTPIVINNVAGGDSGNVTFESGSLLDVGFAGQGRSGSWDVMRWEGELTDNGLQFSASVDQDRWSFEFVDSDHSGTSDTLRVTAASR